ncbi:choline transporter-like protein 1, partial [Asbolus verrucosus]
DVASDINKSAGYIVALCFIGFGFSVGMLLLFRYFVAVVVWVIIIGSLFGIIALTILFWFSICGYLCLDSTSLEYNRPFKPVAIFFTIISLVLVIMLVCMFKRIQLVIRLFKEAIKVLFGIPLIFFEPLLTFFAVSVLFIIFVYYFILMETAGVLQNVGGSLYEYTPNMVMLFTIWFHFVMCIWMEQFIIGCQHMVISGAVSAYYFARDKSAMISPIYNSFYNLFRYHLGTVAFGSLIITVITIIKALIRSLANSRQTKILVDCCLGAIEDFLKYLSKNAYIQTAIHGQPFYKSGKRAVRLLAANALSAVAINSVGDFVLFMAKLLIVVCTIGVGILMNDSSGVKHFWAPIFISAFVTAIIAECFFTVFETAIDTLFICFCEDSCMNDGMDRPYYMSVNLMQYIEDAKKTVKDKN